MEPVSPPLGFENQEDEELQAPGKEDFGKRSPDLDLNQAVSPRADDDDDAEDFRHQPLQAQWIEEGNHDADMASPPHRHSPPPAENLTPSPSPKSPPPFATHQRRSPPPEHFSASRSPKRTPSPAGKRAMSPVNRRSVSPDYHASRKTPSSGRSVSPPARKRSPPPARKRSPSPRRRQSPGKRRSLSRSPDERSILVGSDEGRRQYDRRGSPPVGRSGRGASPRVRERYGRSRTRSRSPPSRDYQRRSRYSPRRRASPPRYHSRRDRSPRRRPWSPPANRSTGVGKPGKNLFVAGFSFVTTERDLEKKFARYGRVTDVRIVRDKRSGDSRGFGFLSLERDEDADAAIRALDQTEWNGRIVLVEKAKTPTR